MTIIHIIFSRRVHDDGYENASVSIATAAGADASPRGADGAGRVTRLTGTADQCYLARGSCREQFQCPLQEEETKGIMDINKIV